MTATLRLTSLIPLVASLAAWYSPLSAQTPGPLTRPPVGAFFDHTLPEQDPPQSNIGADWSTVPAFPNLAFVNPVGILPVPGTNKLMVWEREGRVWTFDNDSAAATKTLVLDLSSQCQGWDDSGLLSLVFHPDFVNNHQIFVWYTWRGGLANGVGEMGPILGNPTTRPPTLTPNRDRLSRFQLDANLQAPLSAEAIMLDQQAQSVWHNGCGMFFHPDNGFLYLTDGDDSASGAGPGSDTTGNTQTILKNLFSCVMRIDVDKRGGTISHAPPARGNQDVTPGWPAYYVPNDNPFVGVARAREEIFALGLRNPFRMTIDPPTRRVFIGDVGAGSYEEINIIEPNDPFGLNFQWITYEGGTDNLRGSYYGVSRTPALYYSHSGQDGTCVIGGYVYRGTAFPELYGKYIFGDAISGRIWYLDESTPAKKKKVLLAILPKGPGPESGSGYRGLSSFGLDAAGELYVCQMSSVAGQIYKLQRGGPPPGTGLPPTLGATGIFSDLTTLTPSPRLTPYEINLPFFSDGAVKSRFAAIPTGTSIGFKPDGEWDFPAGSVFVKHFDLPVSDTDPGKKRRLETRVIVMKADGTVYGATYKWREDQSDADLLENSLTDTFPIETGSFGTLTGQDIGLPATPGTTSRDGRQITLTAGKGGITGISDQFQFARQFRSGDFDVAVRLISLNGSGSSSASSSTAGLMVRESMDPGAPMVAVMAVPNLLTPASSGYSFSVRTSPGATVQTIQGSGSSAPKINSPQTWMRLQRQGDLFIGSVSADGIAWKEIGRNSFEMTRQVEFGLAATASGTASGSITARFEVGTRNQSWYFPSRQDCLSCHNPQAGGVLGMSTRQMNRDATFTGGLVQNQLAAWNHAGYFHDGPADAAVSQLEKLARPDDATASLERRVRSYLDANCANCHRPGGAQAFWDARYLTPLDQQGILNGALVNALGNPAARVVTPGSLANSMIHTRINVTGANQMPPLGRQTIDAQGVALLAQWIGAMPADPADPAPPPYTLTATALTTEEPPHPVKLTWAKSGTVTGVTSLALERSWDGVHFSRLDQWGLQDGLTNDYQTEPFSQIWYRLVFLNGETVTGYSNVAQVFTGGDAPAPEILLSTGDQAILNYDLDAGAKAGTSFGILSPGSASSRSYRIRNTGTLPLHLTGTPRVRLAGADSSSFAVITPPSASIVTPGQSLDFAITFTPQSAGVKNAIVTILCDDPDEATTSFAITGECLASDLAGWWTFDETTGGTAADASGRGNPATIGLTPAAWAANGAIGGALAVTGVSGDGAVISSAPGINPGSAFTLSLWAKAGVWDQGRTLFAKGAYSLVVDGGRLVCLTGSTPLASADLPPTHVWVHLAVVFDTTRTTFYVNGLPAGSVDHDLVVADTHGDLVLGTSALAAPAADHFNGWIDEVRLYHIALDGARVASLAGQTVVVTLTGGYSPHSIGKRFEEGVSLLFTRSGPLDTDLPVNVSITGTALPGVDYDVTPDLQSLVIPSGQPSGYFYLNSRRSGQVTGPREIVVALQEGPGYRLGTPSMDRIDLLDTPYNDWKLRTFGSLDQANSPAAQDDADPDGDGVNNLMEAALGGNPLLPDRSHLPRISFEQDGDFTYSAVSYIRPAAGDFDLTYLTEFSMDLDSWNDTQEFGYPIDNGDGTITVKMYSGYPLDYAPAQFYRLRVEK